MDFERGLLMLKDYVEDGEVHCKLDFEGFSEYPGCSYVAIRTTCKIDELGDKMTSDFTRLMDFMKDRKDLISDAAISIYHKWNPVKNLVEYSAAIPVSSIPENLPAGVITGSVSATKIHKITNEGPYRHIANAWAAQFMRDRAKKFKKNKKMDPFERYLNSPTDTPEKQLKTEICFPVL